MTSFIALYRGDTVATAELVAVTNEAELVAEVARRILRESVHEPEETGDPVSQPLNDGRRRALEAVVAEVEADRGAGQ